VVWEGIKTNKPGVSLIAEYPNAIYVFLFLRRNRAISILFFPLQLRTFSKEPPFAPGLGPGWISAPAAGSPLMHDMATKDPRAREMEGHSEPVLVGSSPVFLGNWELWVAVRWQGAGKGGVGLHHGAARRACRGLAACCSLLHAPPRQASRLREQSCANHGGFCPLTDFYGCAFCAKRRPRPARI
jgi:hypothetical protein